MASVLHALTALRSCMRACFKMTPMELVAKLSVPRRSPDDTSNSDGGTEDDDDDSSRRSRSRCRKGKGKRRAAKKWRGQHKRGASKKSQGRSHDNDDDTSTEGDNEEEALVESELEARERTISSDSEDNGQRSGSDDDRERSGRRYARALLTTEPPSGGTVDWIRSAAHGDRGTALRAATAAGFSDSEAGDEQASSSSSSSSSAEGGSTKSLHMHRHHRRRQPLKRRRVVPPVVGVVRRADGPVGGDEDLRPCSDEAPIVLGSTEDLARLRAATAAAAEAKAVATAPATSFDDADDAAAAAAAAEVAASTSSGMEVDDEAERRRNGAAVQGVLKACMPAAEALECAMPDCLPAWVAAHLPVAASGASSPATAGSDAWIATVVAALGLTPVPMSPAPSAPPAAASPPPALSPNGSGVSPTFVRPRPVRFVLGLACYVRRYRQLSECLHHITGLLATLGADDFLAMLGVRHAPYAVVPGLQCKKVARGR